VSKLSDITAAILAGGLGTRLRSAVADRPKVLAEVHGRPFLSYLLDQLAAAGCREVVLCTGYLGERIVARFGDAYGPLRLRYSQEPAPLGTAGALRLALPLLESDPVLVLNGDSYCQADLAAFLDWHQGHAASATLVLTRVADVSRFGSVEIDADGRVLRFQEKAGVSRPGWINAGIYAVSRPLLLKVPAGTAVSLEREVFPAWIGQGLYGHAQGGRFLDIGTPESYAAAQDFFGGSGGLA